MPLVIHMEPKFISAALGLEPHEREYVEERKAVHGIDPLLKDCCSLLDACDTELENTRPAGEDEQFLSEIRDKFDAAIALVAFAETDVEIAALEKVSVTLGRRYSPQVKVPADVLHPLLKKVFAEVDEEFGVKQPGKGRKRLIRQKVTATIAIINHALGNKKTRRS